MRDDVQISWHLLYTKARAEAWADVNLRRQGFETLLPRVRKGDSFTPLYPRYLFVGVHDQQPTTVLRSTRGIAYVVHCGERPARVPLEVIRDIRSRMDGRGLVYLEPDSPPQSLFARRQQERLRILLKLTQAGFRVRVA